jgi:hypothetical protein
VANCSATQAESGATHSQSGGALARAYLCVSPTFSADFIQDLIDAENLSRVAFVESCALFVEARAQFMASTSSYRRRSELVGEQSCSKKRASFRQIFLSVRTVNHRRACKKFKVDSQIHQDPKSTAV